MNVQYFIPEKINKKTKITVIKTGRKILKGKSHPYNPCDVYVNILDPNQPQLTAHK